MLPTLRARRRPRYGTHICAAVSAILLLLSVILLHSRLGIDRRQSQSTFPSKDLALDADSLFEDAVHDSAFDDRIDEVDIIEEAQTSDASKASDEEEILRGVEMEDDVENDLSKVPKFHFDHVFGVIRRPFDKRSIDKWEDYTSFDAASSVKDLSNDAFASDDLLVDQEARRKVSEVNSVEEALLLKTVGKPNPLREGWGRWFDKKGDFLRRDKMFKSNMDILDPLNHPLLQDPDGIGLTSLTRNDKLVQEFLIKEIMKVPFGVKQPLKSSDTNAGVGIKRTIGENVEAKEFVTDVDESRTEIKRRGRGILDTESRVKASDNGYLTDLINENLVVQV